MNKKIFPVLILVLAALCFPAAAEEITGTVTSIDQYGHAVLNVTPEEFESAGFHLGDVVTVTAKDFCRDMPVFNGYYVERGEYLICEYPGRGTVSLCVNYGSFADETGVGVGDGVTIAMAEKAGALAVQEVSSLVYTNKRADYESDAVFANFRPIRAGDIVEGRLYRSASPADGIYGRAPYSNALAEEAGVRAVMNLANTPGELEALFAADGYSSGYYRTLYEEGRVIPLGLPVDFTSDGFLNGIARGFAFLSAQETPFLIHCTEGKDRAGFASMMIEALMGASREEIILDYMKSYENYYHVQPGTEKYDVIAEINILPMLRLLEKEDPDLQTAAERILLSHGMTGEEIETLRIKLKSEN